MESFDQERDEQAGGEGVDPTSERSSAATEGSSSESTPESRSDVSSRSDLTDESSEPSSGSSESSSETETTGLLAGTGSETQPGVGGTGDHPAPAAVVDPETGELHSAGQPPAGNVASEQSPTGDLSDATDESHALSDKARAALNEVHEPDQVETDRPDIGTPE